MQLRIHSLLAMCLRRHSGSTSKNPHSELLPCSAVAIAGFVGVRMLGGGVLYSGEAVQAAMQQPAGQHDDQHGDQHPAVGSHSGSRTLTPGYRS